MNDKGVNKKVQKTTLLHLMVKLTAKIIGALIFLIRRRLRRKEEDSEAAGGEYPEFAKD